MDWQIDLNFGIRSKLKSAFPGKEDGGGREDLNDLPSGLLDR
jgi:hypothetical protein